MIRYALNLFVIGILMTSPVPSATAAQPDPLDSVSSAFSPTSFTLSNGMQVVVIENHRAPVVSHMIWYKVGGADDPQGKSGIAHFLEHLMFKGTEKAKPQEFTLRVAALGGNDNAFTSHDYTAYYQAVPSEHLDEMMRYEADRMRGLVIPDSEFLSERDVIIEERKQRYDNDVVNGFFEDVMSKLFEGTEYGVPVIGWKDEIPKLEKQDAMDVYHEWYAPANATLVVSGNVEPETVRDLAEVHYGKIEAGHSRVRTRRAMPALTQDRRISKQDEDVEQPMFIKGYIAPSVMTDAPKSYALSVLENILAGGSSSRLYQSLVVQQSKATSISIYYDSDRIGDSYWMIFASPSDDVSLPELEAAIDEEIQKLLSEGVTQDEVAAASRRLRISAIYARDSLQTPPEIVGRALTIGQNLEDVDAWPENIAAVTKDDVDAAAFEIFTPSQYNRPAPVIGYLEAQN